MLCKFFVYNTSTGDILIALSENPENENFLTENFLESNGQIVVNGLNWEGKSAFYNSIAIDLPEFIPYKYNYNSGTGEITEN